MRIVLEGTPPSLNRFAGRGNVWDYRVTKQMWTTAVWAACRASKERPACPFPFARVSIRYYFPTAARHDADNYAGKFLLDGLTKAGVIVDDDMEHIELSVSGAVDRKRPRTEITIEEADNGT